MYAKKLLAKIPKKINCRMLHERTRERGGAEERSALCGP